MGGRTIVDHPSRRGALRRAISWSGCQGAGAVRGRPPRRGRRDDGGGRQRAGAAPRASTRIDRLRPRVAVPGHGALPTRPELLVARTRALHHRPRRPTCGRPWSRACRCSGRSRRCRRPTRIGRSRSTRAGDATPRACTWRRSAPRWVWRTRCHEATGRAFVPRLAWRSRAGLRRALRAGRRSSHAGRAAADSGPSLPALVSTDELARWQAEDPVVVIDVRTDVFAYLKGHLPGAEYLNTRDASRERGRHADAAALRPAPTGAVLPARHRSRPAGGDLQRGRVAEHRRDLPGLAPGRRRAAAGIRARRRVLQVAARAAPGGAAVSPDSGDALSRAGVSAGGRVARGGAGRGSPKARCWWMRVRPTSTRARRVRRCATGISPARSATTGRTISTQEGFGHVWKPAAELRRALRGAGDHAGQGHHRLLQQRTEASHVHFTLRYLLGYPRVRVYVGSWTEWAENERRPVSPGGDRHAPGGLADGPHAHLRSRSAAAPAARSAPPRITSSTESRWSMSSSGFLLSRTRSA